jgi:hypothetical protein
VEIGLLLPKCHIPKFPLGFPRILLFANEKCQSGLAFVARNWTVKVEYLYTDFGSFTNTFAGSRGLQSDHGFYPSDGPDRVRRLQLPFLLIARIGRCTVARPAASFVLAPRERSISKIPTNQIRFNCCATGFF